MICVMAGSSKLSTTSTGIDVTGTVVADGLTVAGPSTLTSGGTTLSMYKTEWLYCVSRIKTSKRN